MMRRYVVIQPFIDLGTFRRPGDIVEADDERAAKLRSMGLIGGTVIEAAVVEPPENAMKVTKPAKRRAGRGDSR